MPRSVGSLRSSAGFRDRVYAIVRAIPPGRVMTYGRIAALIPPPDDVDVAGYERVKARWVGYALAACSDEIPWHRVVNAKGGISQRPGFGPHEQRAQLQAEGVNLSEHGQLDLGRYAWEPDETWLAERKLMSGLNEPARRRTRTAGAGSQARKRQG